MSAKFNVYFQYTTPQMEKDGDGCSDVSKDFDSKRDCWEFVQEVRRHAQKSGTTVDLVIYGEFDEKSMTAPVLYELFICTSYVRETRYFKHAKHTKRVKHAK